MEFIVRFLPRAFVFDGNFKPFVKVCEFAQAHFNRFVVENYAFENVGVGHKGNFCSRFIRLAYYLKFALRHAAIVNLLIVVAVLKNFDFQPFGKRVNYRKPHAVKPARYFVSAAAEFAARVKFG